MNKESRKLERIFKGVANYRRIEILYLVKNQPGITLAGLSESLKCNLKTLSEHSRKLVYSGLIYKKYQGRQVAHFLSPYGEMIVKHLDQIINKITNS